MPQVQPWAGEGCRDKGVRQRPELPGRGPSTVPARGCTGRWQLLERPAPARATGPSICSKEDPGTLCTGWVPAIPVPWLGISIPLSPVLAPITLQWHRGQPGWSVGVLFVEGQRGRSAAICPANLGGVSGAVPRGPCPAPGVTRVTKRLTSGCRLTPPPYPLTCWGKLAVPAPLATQTVITGGRAEASVIIAGDSLVLERRVPRVRQDFPAGLVCGAGLRPGALGAVRALAGSSLPERGWARVRGRAPSSPSLHATARTSPATPS